MPRFHMLGMANPTLFEEMRIICQVFPVILGHSLKSVSFLLTPNAANSLSFGLESNSMTSLYIVPAVLQLLLQNVNKHRLPYL
jgi:hypothetical protein